MPIYEYRCDKSHTFEVMQRMADDSLEKCTICGAPVQRVFHPIAVHFKGSGFYSTDYGKQKGKGLKESTTEAGSSDSGSSSNSGSSTDKGSSADKGSSDKGSSDKGDKKAPKAPAASSSD